MYDVIIIGGASAGLSAALYTSRQNMKTLVLTKDIGGQAMLTPHIENYPGFEMIGGPELMDKFKEQAERFGTECRYEEVKEIKKVGPEGATEILPPSGQSDNGYFIVRTTQAE